MEGDSSVGVKSDRSSTSSLVLQCPSTENWICLECNVSRCSRYVNGHSPYHARSTGHCLVLGYLHSYLIPLGLLAHTARKIIFPLENFTALARLWLFSFLEDSFFFHSARKTLFSLVTLTFIIFRKVIATG